MPLFYINYISQFYAEVPDAQTRRFGQCWLTIAKDFAEFYLLLGDFGYS